MFESPAIPYKWGEFLAFLSVTWKKLFIEGNANITLVNIAGCLIVLTAFIVLSIYGNKYQERKVDLKSGTKSVKESAPLRLRKTRRTGTILFCLILVLGLATFISQGYALSLLVTSILIFMYGFFWTVLFVVCFVVLIGTMMFLYNNVYENFLEMPIYRMIQGLKTAFSWYRK